jgi:hypothetical protein
VGFSLASRGVVYIAIGGKAEQAASASIASLRQYWDGEVTVISDKPRPIAGCKSLYASIPSGSNVQASRYCKTRLFQLSKYDYTLYLDADTLVRGSIDAGFDILTDGYDVAIAHSAAQGKDAMWHVDPDEAWFTLCELYTNPLQLQAGVMFFRKSSAVDELFWMWQLEWQKWQGQDQAALLRALYKVPIKAWMLGRSWNGGSIIEHRFGRARQ